jgi:hypothetical protein
VNYFVTTHHPVAKYNLMMHVATVTQAGNGAFYCVMTTLGCGKDYPTAEAAIRGLVGDHGYRDIQITPKE